MGKRSLCLLLTLVMLLTPAVSAYAEAEPAPAPEVTEAETAEPEIEEPQTEEPEAEEPEATEPEATEPVPTEPEQPAAPEDAEPSEEPGTAEEDEAAPGPEGEANDTPSGEDEPVPGSQEHEADSSTTDEPEADEPAADVSTDEPTAEGSTEDKPTEEEPAEDAPITDKPEADVPSADDPSADEPPVDGPVAEEPSADEPAAEEPAEEEPAEDVPVTDGPTVDDPTVDMPTDDPAADVPTDEPEAEEPTEDEPAEDVPAEDVPSEEEPAEEGPAKDEPAEEEPAEEEPAEEAAVLPAPELLALESTAEGVKLSWKPVEGAALYRILIKDGEEWAELRVPEDAEEPEETAETEYTLTAAVEGERYTLTVLALAEDGTPGEYDEEGLSTVFELPEEPLYESFVYINPLYSGIITEDDLLQPSPIATIATPYAANSISNAVSYMRGQMKNRVVSVSYTLPYSLYIDYTGNLWEDVIDKAYAHTGTANEGDYIAYHFGGAGGKIEGDSSGVVLSYTITYYSNQSQEQQVTSALSSVMSSLNLSGKNDYQKIKAIYDWICSNVTYDYDHLGDSSYMLQFTAYAALVQKHAVCQGYASLFYRMALTAGVDARVVSGYGNGGRHAWDIVRMPDGYYYYVDSTWDAGQYYYNYFLKCQDNFNDHQNAWGAQGDYYDYTSSSWKSEYPIGPTDYDPNKVTSLSAPSITAANYNGSGIKVTWGKVSGAAKYRVFYKPDGGSWTKAGDTTSTSYTWTGAKKGTTYQVRVQCVSSDGKTSTSAYSSTRTVKCLAAPVIQSANFNGSGIKVTWSKVSGAEKYRVFYKPSGGSWAKAGDTTSTSYTWTGAKIGTTYQVRVWCISSSGSTQHSTYNAIRTVKCLSAPNLTSVTSEASGIKVTWGKVSGAEKYRVFYKPSGGSWAKAGDTTSNTYTWTGAKSGTTYQIRVWCISSDGTTQHSTYSSIKTITYKPGGVTQLPAPKLSKVENVNGGIQVTWSKVSGAAKYRVFYKPSGGSWAKAGDTTSNTYTWKGAKSGTTYQIRVWCVSSDGKTATSTYDTIKTIKYIAAPQNMAVSNVSNGIKVTWTKSAGAAKYRVFYKPSGGSWAKAGDTTSNTYTWTGAKSGTTYQIRVWCVSSDGKTATSSYTAIKTIKYIAAPNYTLSTPSTGGIKLSWSKVTGASRYTVFYKTTGDWKTLTTTTATSYTFKSPKAGTKYTFRVRCVNSAGAVISGYITDMTITYKSGIVTQLPAPKLSKVENVNGGVQVTWGKVTGAEKYRVFYKPSGGSWAKAGDTTGTTYTWTGAKSGTTYQIRVWCVSSDGKTATSTYDTIKTIKYIAAPQNVAVSCTSSGIKVTWTKSAGAAKYRVFYKPSGGSWAKAGDTTSNTYTWTGAKSGTTYQIRVWCVSSDGKTQASAYASVKTITYTPVSTVASGNCGAQGSNVTWRLTSDGVLTISGKGAMGDWDSYSGSPWYAYRYDISTVKINSGVTTIGDCAFFYTNLKSVTIPSSVTSIGDQAFWQCTGLKSVTIPASVTSIGSQTFAACDSLTAISVASGNKNYCAVNGVLFNKTKTVLIQCPAGKTGSYSIPSGVNYIGDVAFQGCTGLTSVTIPGTVYNIGWSAFNVCTGLKKVTIPSGVINIEDYAFDYCSSLTSVTIPASVTYIGYGVFNRCPSNLVIYGKKGSIAETYAAENGIGFSTGTAP